MTARIGTAVLVLTVGASAADAQEVNGFHGYEWGTPSSQVEELADALVPEGEPFDYGWREYVTPVELLGYDGHVTFYFDAEDRLVSGRFSFDVTIAQCHAAWARFSGAIRRNFPTLTPVERRPKRDRIDRGVYNSECEHFAYNPDEGEWSLRLRSGGVSWVTLELVVEPLSPVLRIVYQSPDAVAAIERSNLEDEALLGPVDTTLDGFARSSADSLVDSRAVRGARERQDGPALADSLARLYPIVGHRDHKFYLPTAPDCRWSSLIFPGHRRFFKSTSAAEAAGYRRHPGVCKRGTGFAEGGARPGA